MDVVAIACSQRVVYNMHSFILVPAGTRKYTTPDSTGIIRQPRSERIVHTYRKRAHSPDTTGPRKRVSSHAITTSSHSIISPIIVPTSYSLHSPVVHSPIDMSRVPTINAVPLAALGATTFKKITPITIHPVSTKYISKAIINLAPQLVKSSGPRAEPMKIPLYNTKHKDCNGLKNFTIQKNEDVTLTPQEQILRNKPDVLTPNSFFRGTPSSTLNKTHVLQNVTGSTNITPTAARKLSLTK